MECGSARDAGSQAVKQSPHMKSEHLRRYRASSRLRRGLLRPRFERGTVRERFLPSKPSSRHQDMGALSLRICHPASPGMASP